MSVEMHGWFNIDFSSCRLQKPLYVKRGSAFSFDFSDDIISHPATNAIESAMENSQAMKRNILNSSLDMFKIHYLNSKLKKHIMKALVVYVISF